ncbi:MAG: Ldh family oxidoreductase [bacterium]|nr:Ldh family oxidoreductase [bacterium]
MPGYPVSDTERRVSFQDLHRFLTALFERLGMNPEDAALLGRTLAVADLRGVHSHGVIRVPEYVKKLTADGVDPVGQPQLVSDRHAALVVDARNAMGAVAAHFAMRQAIERARATNVALAVVRNSNHCGAMFYYPMMALDEDMIGLAATNALPTMAPWGGVDKIIGINPLAVAAPANHEPPLVLDAAFSYSSHGKIRIYHQKGAPIPPTWAFDIEGQPTTDPAAAMEGMLQPIGEYKGVALALTMGVLSSLLSGAAYGTELGNMETGPKAGQDGHFFLAIRIAAFEDVAKFRHRVDGIIQQIRNSRRAAGVDRLYAPGEIEAETEKLYHRDGIPLNDETLAGLDQAATNVGMEVL